MQEPRRTRVCFIRPEAYSLFNTASTYPFGGAEVRAFHFATGLSRLPNYDVSFVVYSHGQPAVEQYGSIRVYAHPAYGAGEHAGFFDRAYARLMGKVKRLETFPYVAFRDTSPSILLWTGLVALWKLYRAIRWRLPIDGIRIEDYVAERKSYRIYEEIDADIYCVFGVYHLAAEVAAYCEAAGKQSLLFTTLDSNFSETYQPGSHERNEYNQPAFLCHYALTHASRIITQSQKQAALLKRRFGRESVLIRNPLKLDGSVEPIRTFEERDTALWIGRSDFSKRPEILLRLAALFPRVHFEMVMTPLNPVTHRNVVAQLSPNIAFHEHVPFHDIEKLYSRAFVYISTSPEEGFPNAFLQAGKYAVPILSLEVDPDDFVKTYECGIVANGDFDRLVEGLRLLQNKGTFERLSANIYRYVRLYHDFEATIRELDRALQWMVTNDEARELSGTSPDGPA